MSDIASKKRSIVSSAQEQGANTYHIIRMALFLRAENIPRVSTRSL